MNEMHVIRSFRSGVAAPTEEAARATRAAILRSRDRRWGRRWQLAVAIATALAATASGLAAAGGIGDLFEGTPIPSDELTASDRFVLSASGASGSRVERIATRGGRDFYVIHRADTGDCFASGTAGRAIRLGVTMCPKEGTTFRFPSREQPILDQSSYTIGGADSLSRLEHLAGFAADAVSVVAVVAADGAMVVRVPVVD